MDPNQNSLPTTTMPVLQSPNTSSLQGQSKIKKYAMGFVVLTALGIIIGTAIYKFFGPALIKKDHFFTVTIEKVNKTATETELNTRRKGRRNSLNVILSKDTKVFKVQSQKIIPSNDTVIKQGMDINVVSTEEGENRSKLAKRIYILEDN